jgi:hypothetical protein
MGSEQIGLMRDDPSVLIYVPTLLIPCTSRCKSHLPIQRPFKYFYLHDTGIDGVIIHPWCQQGSRNLSWKCTVYTLLKNTLGAT